MAKESSKEKTGAADEARQAVLNWELKTLIDPYESAGHTNPKWDGFARTALTEFARSSSDVWTPGENYQTIISNACVSAAKAGCDDPIMRYLSLGYASWPPESRTNLSDAYCQTAIAMANSSYPATRKYWTWLRARDQVYNTYGTNTEFSESLRDKTMPQSLLIKHGRLAAVVGPIPSMPRGGHNLSMTWESPVKLWKKRGSSTHPTRAFRPRCCVWNSARVTGGMKWKSGFNAP
jgi:hypothetical protein